MSWRSLPSRPARPCGTGHVAAWVSPPSSQCCMAATASGFCGVLAASWQGWLGGSGSGFWGVLAIPASGGGGLRGPASPFRAREGDPRGLPPPLTHRTRAGELRIPRGDRRSRRLRVSASVGAALQAHPPRLRAPPRILRRRGARPRAGARARSRAPRPPSAPHLRRWWKERPVYQRRAVAAWLERPLLHRHEPHRVAHVPRRAGDSPHPRRGSPDRQPFPHASGHLPRMHDIADGRRVAHQPRHPRRPAWRALRGGFRSGGGHLACRAAIGGRVRAALPVHVRAMDASVPGGRLLDAGPLRSEGLDAAGENGAARALPRLGPRAPGAPAEGNRAADATGAVPPVRQEEHPGRSQIVSQYVEEFAGSTEEWDGFVRAQPHWTHCHLSGWKTVMTRALGHECSLWAARDSERRLVAVLPLVQVNSLLFGHYLVSMPFLNYGGPLGTDAGVQALVAHATARATRDRVKLLELRSRTP